MVAWEGGGACPPPDSSLHEAYRRFGHGFGRLANHPKLRLVAADVFAERTPQALGMPGAHDQAGHQFALRHVGKDVDKVQGKLFGVVVDHHQVAVLAEHLFWAGAELVLSDIDQEKVHRLADKFGAQIVSPDQVLNTECDILAPCAMGGMINDQTLQEFQ